ncbi:hypothetical protein [Pseudogemmobacter hezensis]|uniref:hypothetical protein n=1 Tax=Pseudogemmobacter hezensis TaxID=2737662 RepID=UPI0020A68D7B|nr:hypothetical protein [Pseudogemmobacter hezensis]
MKILLLGDYGLFGGRLARLMQDMAGLELLICRRAPRAAQAFYAGWRGGAAAADTAPLVTLGAVAVQSPAARSRVV